MKISPILSLVFALFLSVLSSAQPNYPADPAEARLVSTDIQHFVEAFQTLTEETDTVQVLQSLYFDRASPGLQEYISRFQLTAEDLAKAIQGHPEDYRKIPDFLAGLEKWMPEYTAEMQKFKEVLPDAIFPPTYLLVADHKGIANASKFGQLVSVEKRHATDLEALKNTIVHELTHFQQAMTMGIAAYTGIYGKEDNMLDLILREGSAEFVTYKLVRKNEEQFSKLRNYMENEATLWEKFQLDLAQQDSDFWLNVSYEDNNKGVPIQMGYGLGYRIVEAYYQQAQDKGQALNDILNIQDAGAFLLKSQYEPK